MSIKKDLFTDIGSHLMSTLTNFDPALNLPNLQWFDKQMGQFLTPELYYTLPLPCILMTYMPFQWNTVGKQQQRGTGALRFDIYFENYADSFSGAVNSVLALRFFDYTEAVHQALQGFTLPYMSPLERINDNEDTAQDNIITSSVEYGTIISDIATDYSRNYTMADPAVIITKVDATSRPAAPTFTDGFVLPGQ